MVDIDSKIINWRKIERERGNWGLDREGMLCQEKRNAWGLVKEGMEYKNERKQMQVMGRK